MMEGKLIKPNPISNEDRPPTVNLRKLAEFWQAGSFQRRRIVREIKFPPKNRMAKKGLILGGFME